MDNDTKQQILNIIKTKGFNINKFKFVAIKENLYKFCINESFITYIETWNRKIHTTQTMNWKPKKKHMLPYIKKLEIFAFDVVCIVEVVDSIDILSACINSLKQQLSEPYILLIATNQEERQFAIDSDIDFVWSTDKWEHKRLDAALNYVKTKLKETQNIMLCNSNTIIPEKWIIEGMKIMNTTQYDVVGTNIQYILDNNQKCGYSRQLNTMSLANNVLYDGLIISKSILTTLNWNIVSKEFKNDLNVAICSSLIKSNASIAIIKIMKIYSIIHDNAINSLQMKRSNLIEPVDISLFLPLIQSNASIMKLANIQLDPVNKPKVIKPKKVKRTRRANTQSLPTLSISSVPIPLVPIPLVPIPLVPIPLELEVLPKRIKREKKPKKKVLPKPMTIRPFVEPIKLEEIEKPIRIQKTKIRKHKKKKQRQQKGDLLQPVNYKKKPLISIVLPTYRGYPHIRDIVEDMENQFFKDFELVIINDGSNQMELTKYLDSISNSWTKVVSLKQNGGLPNALNVGINSSVGQYWTWISDDNRVKKEFLYKLKLKLDEGFDFVYSNYILIDAISKRKPKMEMNIGYETIVDLFENWKGMPSYMWKMDLIKKIGYFDKSIQGCEDYEYVIRTFVACQTKRAHITDHLFMYYKRNNTLSTKLSTTIPILKSNTVYKYRCYKELQQLYNILQKDNCVVCLVSDIVSINKLIVIKLCTNKIDIIVKQSDNVYLVDKDIFNICCENFAVSLNICYNDQTAYFKFPNICCKIFVKSNLSDTVAAAANNNGLIADIVVHMDNNSSIDNLYKSLLIEYTVIYPPLISYDELKQRPVQLIESFAKLKGVRAIFIDKEQNAPERKGHKLMILNKNTFDSNIRSFIKGKLVLYYTYPNDIIYKDVLNPDYSIYDLIDNPTDEFKHWKTDYLTKSIMDADLFTVSAPFLNKYGKQALTVSNGCDYAHFSQNIEKKQLPNNKITIGYYGAHAPWLDMDLIRKIASYDPDRFTVVMIGKNKDYKLTFEHSNITWLDHQSYVDLPNFLASFDICMIPFKLTEMIKGCDPIKFYEYLSAGKPVLVTRIGPLLQYSESCYFMDHKNYKQMIEKAYLEKDNISLINKRKQIALNNTWDSKAEMMFTKLIGQSDTVDNKITILYPPYLSWYKMYQRPQQMLTALSKKSGIKCVFIDYTIKSTIQINDSLILVKTYKEAIKHLEGKIILYYNNPETVNHLHLYSYDKNIFELVDMPKGEFSEWQLTLSLATDNCDLMSMTSKEMIPYATELKKDYVVIPNGADFDHFEKARYKLIKPLDFPKTKKIVIGYYGAHAPWLDWQLIKSIANLSYVHVVMIGKMDKHYNLSITHKNITWLSIKQYSELPNYLSYFDICMIPFKLTEMIKGCDPIKFYEYCSAGKPVITTGLHELQKYKDICYFMDNNNYESVINRAVIEKDNNELILKRQDVAKSNSWVNRVDLLLNTLDRISC